MYVSETKKGFLTFLTTLVIAGGIYFSAYYAVNTLNSKAVIEEGENTPTEEVMGVTTQVDPQTEVVTSETTDTKAEKPSIFSNLIETDKKVVLVQEQAPSVLAGSDQSSQGATPVTGSNTIIFACLLGTMFVLVGTSTYNHARKAAIQAFEKRMRNKF